MIYIIPISTVAIIIMFIVLAVLGTSTMTADYLIPIIIGPVKIVLIIFCLAITTLIVCMLLSDSIFDAVIGGIGAFLRTSITGTFALSVLGAYITNRKSGVILPIVFLIIDFMIQFMFLGASAWIGSSYLDAVDAEDDGKKVVFFILSIVYFIITRSIINYFYPQTLSMLFGNTPILLKIL